MTREYAAWVMSTRQSELNRLKRIMPLLADAIQTAPTRFVREGAALSEWQEQHPQVRN